MYPSQHAGLTAVALPLLRAKGWQAPALGLFAAGAVLIDVDHYLSYALREGDWSLLNAYRWYSKRVPTKAYTRPHLYWPRFLRDDHRPFHTVAALVALGLLGRVFPPLRPLFWGALFHRCCDYAVEMFHHGPGVPKAGPGG